MVLTKTKKAKRNTVLFDSIMKARDMVDGKGTIWTGAKGTYIIRHLEPRRTGHPVAKVLLNSQYLTGLFPTRDRAVYSADMKAGKGNKIYLLFMVVGEGQMRIEQVVTKQKD